VYPVGKTIRRIEKWMASVLMGTTSSITMQSLGKIVQRAPAVGAKTWCLYVFTGRMPRSGKLRYCFYSQTKNQVFRPAGRLVAPIQVKLCRTDGHLGPLGCAKFHLNRPTGMGMRSQKYQKFPLFGKESPRSGDSLDRFPKFLGVFIRLTILR